MSYKFIFGNKKLSEINEENLQSLITNQVAEGWYIEYKREMPSQNPKNPAGLKIAAGLAAFANSRGGYYIVGVEDDENNIANDVCGFNNESNLKEKIQGIVTKNVSPVPFFESHIINLENGKIVLIIEVREGFETPYLCSDGKVYVRQGEAKDPIVEKDRHLYQKLIDKGSKLKEKIDDFSKNPYLDAYKIVNRFEKTIGNKSLIEIYLYTHPYNDFIFEDFFSIKFKDKLYKLFNSQINCFNNSASGNLTFKSIQTSTNSYILQTENSNYSNINTIEIFKNGNIKIILPLFEYNLERSAYHGDIFTGIEPNYESKLVYWEQYKKLLNNKFTKDDFDCKILDLNNVQGEIILLLTCYMSILEEYSYPIISLKYRLKISNVFKKFIFLDNSDFINHLKETDILVVAKNEIEFPNFKNNFPADLDSNMKHSGDSHLSLNQFLPFIIMINVLGTLGYNPFIFDTGENYLTNFGNYLNRINTKTELIKK